MSGLYIHVPFCAALCPYCDFAVVVGKHDLHERYAGALRAELAAARWPEPFDTVFIGGGTPSFVDPSLLAAVLADVEVSPGAEVSIEANPESVSAAAMGVLAAAGVNRVSIGAQSFAAHVLRGLGREHGPEDTARAVAAVRAADIAAVNLDLIYGGPGETDQDWRASLDAALALAPAHLSCYGLMIEERTAFGAAVARGDMPAPDDDVLAERYEVACDVLAAAGYEHYEVSNWARPGAACRHNLTYWTQGDYLGLGIGAHSHRDGVRWWNERSLSRYLADPAHARAGEEHLSERARAEEWLSLRLRLGDGFDAGEADRRLGGGLDPAVEALVEHGLLEREGDRVRLTRRGMLLDNEVTARLLAAAPGP